MNATLLASLSLCLLPAAEPKSAAEEARPVIAAVVKAAEENAARQTGKLDGDALGDFYIRRAAAAARDGDLPPRAFLLGIGVALDSTDLLRKNVLLRGVLTQAESDQERERRLKVLGKPTVRGRHDWIMHFAVSAALTSQLGPETAEQIGLTKEFLDARDGGSGFSFADLAADYAGVAFANRVLDRENGKKLLAAVAEGFKGDDYLPKIDDLEDGLPAAKLHEKYGKSDDPRFLKHCEEVRKRVMEASALKPPR